jgi:AAA15 family ATPase/GTPase
MIIKSCEIKSYRSCINTHVDVSNDLTALIGINGSGKSNILHALLLLKDLYEFDYPRQHEDIDNSNICEFKITFERKGKPLIVDIKISYQTDEYNSEKIIDLVLKWDFTHIFGLVSAPIEFPRDFFEYERYYSEKGDPGRFPKYIDQFLDLRDINASTDIIKKVYPIAKEALLLLNSISYYGASQFADPSQCPNFIEIEEERLVRNYRVSSQHEKFIIDLFKASRDKDSTKYNLYLSTVNSLGIGLINDIKFESFPISANTYKVLSGGKIKNVERRRVLIVPNFVINRKSLSPNQLSDGTFRSLALIFYILTDESKILLIEEPETSVHHGLLNSIVSIIKSQSKYKQVILSTHSDSILDQLFPENIILVNRSPKNGTSAKLLSEAMSKSNFSKLKEYLAVTGNLGEYIKESSL